jgi:hypothetical protein
VDPWLDDTSETEAGVRWMAGRSSNAGTLEKGLTEMRPSLVSSDIKVRFRALRHFRLNSFPTLLDSAEQGYQMLAPP